MKDFTESNDFVPYEKLSKKNKKKHNAMDRVGWGNLHPVTRVHKNPTDYNRKDEKKKTKEYYDEFR